MKKVLPFLFIIIFSLTSYSQLNTKLIASKYGKGVVKVILFDADMEKAKPGSGYLSRGSGFFVTRDGYIFTNRHVVEMCVKGYIDYDYKTSTGSSKSGFATYSEDLISDENFVKAYRTGYPTPVIQVFHGPTEKDYKLYTAKVIAIGMGAFDGALLKVVSDEQGNTSNFRFTSLPIGNSDKVQQGEQLCVFGYPAQIRGGASIMLRDMSTLSTGIMSGHDFVFNKDYGYIKTDAEIHPGNSGGPVFNEENRVIGIATSKGVQTGIGLVGGINGMYYISASEANAHRRLITLGLKLPERSFSINTVTGDRQPMKTLDEINGSAGPPKPKPKPDPADPFAKSKIYFSNISILNNNNKFPSISQRSKTFAIDRKKGGKIWIYVDNYPNPLNTDQILVLIDKLKKGKYQKFKDQVYNVKSTSDYTYFSYSFYEKGSYKFRIYSKENKYINSGTVVIKY